MCNAYDLVYKWFNVLKEKYGIKKLGLSHFLQEKLGIKVDVVSERAVKKNLRAYIENDLVKV